LEKRKRVGIEEKDKKREWRKGRKWRLKRRTGKGIGDRREIGFRKKDRQEFREKERKLKQ
jgi:hypothetical protein